MQIPITNSSGVYGIFIDLLMKRAIMPTNILINRMNIVDIV